MRATPRRVKRSAVSGRAPRPLRSSHRPPIPRLERWARRGDDSHPPARKRSRSTAASSPTLTRPSRRADIVRMAVRLLQGPFTVDDYQRLAELGVLREHDRVELIAGQVVAMTPIGDRHASCVRRLNRLLSRALLDVAIIDVQDPVVLSEHDAPQPDVALLKARADAYLQHPRSADTLLVIEVAETSLAYDREVKIPLYARSDIPEVWLVDLPADHIDVYRNPSGGTYADTRSTSRGDTLTPLRFPHVTLRVDDILG